MTVRETDETKAEEKGQSHSCRVIVSEICTLARENASLLFIQTYDRLDQAWANYGPRAMCGPLRF